MKKIYTLIAAVAVCASLNAQTYFKVTCGNKVVKAGDTCISKIFDDWGGGWGQYSSDLKVEVLEECELTIKVTNTGDLGIEYCWATPSEQGQCVPVKPAESNTKTYLSTPEDGVQDLEIHYTTMDASEIVNLTMELEIWATEDDENVFKFKSIFGNDPKASVSSLELTQGVVLKGNNLEYVGLGASNVVVCDLTGRIVKSGVVSGEGTIDLSTLPAGLYIYLVKGNSSYKGKVRVR